MSHIKSFDFYSPVLSSDIIKDPQPIQNDEIKNEVTDDLNIQTLNSQPNGKKKKKKNKNKKNKKILLKQQQNELLNKIKIPETQEDIDAWIAERKKKFPTRKRIEEKKQDLQDREERGALDLSEKANKEKRMEKKRKAFQFNVHDKNKPIEMSVNRPTKIPSILDKITQDEERKKHSIILQCFRYFVKHNFLQDQFNPDQKQEEYSYYSSEYYSDDDDDTVVTDNNNNVEVEDNNIENNSNDNDN